MTMSPPKVDLTETLRNQHEEVVTLLTDLGSNPDRGRRARLVHLLAVHETAEEAIIYSELQRRGGDASRVADVPLEEQNEAAMSALDPLDVRDPGFLEQVAVVAVCWCPTASERSARCSSGAGGRPHDPTKADLESTDRKEVPR